MRRIGILVLFVTVLMLGSNQMFGDVVTNGDFKNSTTTGWTINYAPDGSNFNIGTPTTGISSSLTPNAANFGGSEYDEIAQTLTTISGKVYTLTFYLANSGFASRANADFSVWWGNTLVLDIPASSAFGFTEYSLYLNGTGRDILSFDGYQFGGWYSLEKVSVTYGTPEPGTMILFGSGLFGLVGAMRRKFGMIA